MTDSNTAKRIQALERTVDILTRHLLDNYLILQDFMDRYPNDEMSMSPVINGIEKNIELLQQVTKLSRQ
jgi:hypothetical protein